jgi:hypothetical protein
MDVADTAIAADMDTAADTATADAEAMLAADMPAEAHMAT